MSNSDTEILQIVKEKFENQGDGHSMTNIDTPIRDDAFKLSDEEKIELNQRFTQLIEQQLRNGSKVSTLPSEMQERLEELEIPEQFKEKSLMEKTETTEQTEEII